MPLLPIALAVLVAGCATAAPPALAPDHPAHADAPASAAAVSVAPLGAVAAPTLPPALRPADDAPASHAAHGDDDVQMAGVSGREDAAPDDPRLDAALAAYFALHDALASDDLAGAQAHGLHAAAALAAWLDGAAGLAAPDAEAVRDALPTLTTAADLAAARVAFGHVSAPLARLVATAAPGLAVERARCGMAQGVPEQGIWLQRPGPLRNPYFGSAMLACGTRQAPSSAEPADAHAGH